MEFVEADGPEVLTWSGPKQIVVVKDGFEQELYSGQIPPTKSHFRTLWQSLKLHARKSQEEVIMGLRNKKGDFILMEYDKDGELESYCRPPWR